MAIILFLILLLVPRPSSALTVSPSIHELILNTGKRSTYRIVVINDQHEPVNLTSSVGNFESGSTYGTPHFVAPGVAASWVTVLPKTFTLEPGARQMATVAVDVPQDAAPGGHYLAAFFESKEAKEGSVGVGLRLASLLLLRVEGGSVKESLRLKNFSTPYLRARAPVDFKVTVENTGNVHLRPAATITIQDLFKNVVARVAVNSEAGNVLPLSEREYKAEWKEARAGWYRAELTLVYGSHGETHQARTHFMVLPPPAIIVLVGILGIVITLFIVSIIVSKKYRRAL